MTVIYSNMDLGILDIRIREALGGCEIWGELNLSESEYTILAEKILSEIGGINPAGSLVRLFKIYPHIMVTHLIHFILFEYDRNFWEVWAGKFNLQLDINHQTSIGKEVLSIFIRSGFTKWDNDGYKYVTPIVCQAGIPVKSYDELFEILENGIHSSEFSPFELLEDLLGWKSHQIEKAPERYFRSYPEKSAELLLSIRNMMIMLEDSDLNQEGLETLFKDIPSRVIKRYTHWKQELLDTNKIKKTQTFFSMPKLFFNHEGKGVSILLPEQIIRNEYIFKASWKIFYDENSTLAEQKLITVREKDNRYFIESLLLPIDVADSYNIELWDDIDTEKPMASWNIRGIHNKASLLFDAIGKLVLDSSIPNQTSILILNSKTHIIERKNINLAPITLPRNWSNFEAFQVKPTSWNPTITLSNGDDIYKMVSKSNVRFSLLPNSTLFGEKYTDRQTPVCINWPSIIASADFAEPINECWEFHLRHLQSGQSASMKAIEFSGHPRAEYDLSELARQSETNSFGRYEIRAYEKREFKKAMIFQMAPEIAYKDRYIEKWPTMLSYLPRTGFLIDNDMKGAEIEFISNVRIENNPIGEPNWKYLSTVDPDTKIKGSLIIKHRDSSLKIPFEKTVRKLQWSFWNEASVESERCDEIRSFFLDELHDTKWWIAIQLNDEEGANSIVRLALEDRHGETLQILDVVVSDTGNWTVPLSVFYTTIQENPAPLKLIFHYWSQDEGEKNFCLAKFTERVILKRLKHQVLEDGSHALFWDQTDKLQGKRIRIQSLNYPNDIREIDFGKIKTTPSGRQYIKLKNIILPGSCMIDTFEEDSFFSVDSNTYKPIIFSKEKILYVNVMSIDINQCRSAFEFLSVAAIHIGSAANLRTILHLLERGSADDTFFKDYEESAKILFTLIMNANGNGCIDQDQKDALKDIIQYFSIKVLDNWDRGFILQSLLGCSMSEEDMKEVISALNLYRLKIQKGLTLSEELNDKLWETDRILASLWALKADQIKSKQDQDRLFGTIGTEFFRDVLKTDNKISINKEIWGDSSEFINMFDWGDGRRPTLSIKLDFSRKATNGLALAGSKYLDLLIEWYRDIGQNRDHSNNQNSILSQISEIDKSCYEHSKTIDKIVYFERVLESRKNGEGKNFYLIFYYSALLSIIEAFASESKENIASKKYNLFWTNAFKFFPQLVIRDLLIAETYRYFIIERGAELCQ